MKQGSSDVSIVTVNLYHNMSLCLQVNALDTLGQTALHRAALAGHLQTCRLLLGYGADASLVSLQGFTAAQMGNEAVQQILNGGQTLCVCVCVCVCVGGCADV